MSPPHDTPRSAVVIGSGPAGAAAATLLARAGWRIDLVEAKAFPRVKVCGEFVSPAATAILERLLTPADLRSAGARLVGTLVLERGAEERAWAMPAPAWSLSRSSLDTLLAARATDAGAMIHQPAAVTRVDYADRGVRATLADGRVLAADVVLHADGAGRHDPAGPTPTRRGVVGLKCHLATHVVGLRMRAASPTGDPRQPHAGLRPRGYVGLVAVEAGLATCALVAAADLVAHHRGDHDALLTDLWPGYDPRTRERAGDLGRWHACGVHGSPFIPAGHPRSFRLGNAAAAVEPVGGEGIGLALWSAHELARLLTSVPAATLAEIHRAYARAYRARLRARRPACRAAAEVLARPALATLAWPMLAAPSLTIAPWYRLSGKPSPPRPA